MPVDVDKPDLYLWCPFVKTDDEQRMVYGYASSPRVDRDGQEVDPAWLKTAYQEWFDKYGNVRYMHQAKPVGKARVLEWHGDKPWIGAYIDDDDTWRQIKLGILNGFSIGIKQPKLAPSQTAPRGKFIGGEVIETSAVDVPSNYDSDFAFYKGAEGDVTFSVDSDNQDGKIATEEDESVKDKEQADKAVEPEIKKDADDGGEVDMGALAQACKDAHGAATYEANKGIYKDAGMADEDAELMATLHRDHVHEAIDKAASVKGATKDDLEKAAQGAKSHAEKMAKAHAAAFGRKAEKAAAPEGVKPGKMDFDGDTDGDKGKEGHDKVMSGKNEEEERRMTDAQTGKPLPTSPEVGKAPEPVKPTQIIDAADATLITDAKALSEKYKVDLDKLAEFLRANAKTEPSFDPNNKPPAASAPAIDPNANKTTAADKAGGFNFADEGAFKAAVAAEVARILAEQEVVTKTTLPDATKSALDGLSVQLGEVVRRLETVEQMAAPGGAVQTDAGKGAEPTIDPNLFTPGNGLSPIEVQRRLAMQTGSVEAQQRTTAEIIKASAPILTAQQVSL